MLDSLRGLGQTLLGAARTRLELFATEVEEQGARLAHAAICLALAGFCLALAVVTGTILLIVLFWDSNRIAILAILSGAFAVAGFALVLAARAAARARPRVLAATLGELESDIAALRAAAAEKQP